MGALLLDASGNLYGTTLLGGSNCEGGPYCSGTAYELTLGADGTWAETILHSFGHGTDGAEPTGSLIVDAAGNLYGTTASGGRYLVGTVFEITP